MLNNETARVAIQTRTASTPARSAQTTGLDQRRHDRFPVHIPGILRLPEIRGGTYLITVLDISKSGLRVSCSRTLPQGARVEVKFNDSTVFGVARYARAVADEFHTGIEADGLETVGHRTQGAELDLTVLFPAKNGNSGRVTQ